MPLSELPGYYDSERIGAYYDGPFRMNLPGLVLPMYLGAKRYG